MIKVLTRQLLVLLTLCSIGLMTEGYAASCQNTLSEDEKNQEILEINLYGLGIITSWGIAKWDYFSRSTHANTEDWFANSTKSGGADKLGHLYTTYVTSHGLSYLLEKSCFNKQDAALYGAMSSFVILGYMEIGDSFSDFGFSAEDLLMNALGSAAGYYLYRNPHLSEIIDIRWEYGYHRESNDFTTDYENSKYLLALKLNGFKKTRKNFLKHVELHMGYYTRGFSGTPTSTPANKERNIYFGIGFNLTDYFKRRAYNKPATILKYFQLPGTYIEFSKDLNN